MQFADVLGQASIKDVLFRFGQSQRIPHALLFLGPEGSGTLPMALAFAQQLLCESPGPNGGCGECSHCRKAAKWIHPDLHFSFPTVGAKIKSDVFLAEWRTALAENPYHNINQWLGRIAKENQQGNINKDECVNIVKKLSLKTYEAERKVMVIWMAEYLGKEGNRLLKLIEEPPPNTHFILIAENQDLILNTILSRCQLVQFQALSDEEIVQGLTGRLQVSKEQAETAALLADGNYNEAQQLVQEVESDFSRLFIVWMRHCYRLHPSQILPWIDEFVQLGRVNQKHFFRYGLHFLQQLIRLQLMGTDYPVRLRPAERETAKRMSEVIPFDRVEAIAELFNDSIYHIERNVNPKVMMMDNTFRLFRIIHQGEGVVAQKR